MNDTGKMKKKFIILTTSAALIVGSFTSMVGTSPAVEAATLVQEANIKSAVRGKEGYISSQPRFVEYRSGQALSNTQTPAQENQQSNNESATKPSWEKKADQIIQDGLELSGAPYRFGASAGSGYFDCSSFTQYVYKKNGISLPRNSRQQYNAVDKIKTSQLRKGDLVFFDTKQDGRIDHVAIYIGDNKLLHTYKVGIGVTVSKANNYWKSRYVGAGRVIK